MMMMNTARAPGDQATTNLPGKWPSAARRLSARRALPKDTTALSLVVSLSTTLIVGYEDGILRWALQLLAFEDSAEHF